VPVGDCQRAFAAAAEADGVLLGPSRLPWINQRGHFGLPPEADAARVPLEAIFSALNGDPGAQAAKRTTPLTGDFIEASTGSLIEIDESQHFTSFRATSLDLYPSDALLGFDPDHYLALCRELARAPIATGPRRQQSGSVRVDASASAPTTMPCGT